MQLAVGGDVSVLGQSISAPANAPSNQLTQAKSGIEIQAGEEAVLDANGGLISRNMMSEEQFSQLVEDTMGGQNLLPESHVISLVYQQLYGLPNQELLSILGSDWLIASRQPYPRLRGANNLVVPDNKLPKKEEEDQKEEEEKIEEKDEQTEPEPEPEPEPIVLNYVCRSFSGNPVMAYYTGGYMGGSLSQAVRFQTTSRASAT